MSNKIIKFFNEVFGKVRGVYLNDQPWLFAKDVCDALDLKDVTSALRALDDDEKMTLTAGKDQLKALMTVDIADGQKNDSAQSAGSKKRGGARMYNIVNELGLYRLIFASRKPKARDFQRWVFHEVLPILRREGEYQMAWSSARFGGKITRRTLTDALANLFKYAVARDEFHHDDSILFQNYSKLVNKVVGIAAGDRDNLTAKQLFELDTCENICAKTIAQGMRDNLSQHDIYEACKSKLDAWQKLINE